MLRRDGTLSSKSRGQLFFLVSISKQHSTENKVLQSTDIYRWISFFYPHISHFSSSSRTYKPFSMSSSHHLEQDPQHKVWGVLGLLHSIASCNHVDGNQFSPWWQCGRCCIMARYWTSAMGTCATLFSTCLRLPKSRVARIEISRAPVRGTVDFVEAQLFFLRCFTSGEVSIVLGNY